MFCYQGKLELFTGAQAGTMTIKVFNKDDEQVCILDDDNALLGSYPIDDGMRFHVSFYKLVFYNKSSVNLANLFGKYGRAYLGILNTSDDHSFNVISTLQSLLFLTLKFCTNISVRNSLDEFVDQKNPIIVTYN